MTDAGMTTAASPTVDPAEVARFAALAAQWWDPRGKMGMLHKFNPVRLSFIKEAACRQFARDPKRLDSLAGLRVLDIGCGGGILSEPLARLGAQVVGAEYVLRWLPRGTHRWDKFVTPNEFEAALERQALHVVEETGVVYDLFADRWRLAGDMDVNYMLAAEKPLS